ncbi:MAG TPA: bifunctional precorrin-2 dehydrogenase/sirohydrochlorin ferrochelatase [Stellaceae bacterium]|nr:bifunctional precorrin-2 dehydrogenase/sirohydrochlorin ferrochelatase [Stellaceae bacterium]
MLPITIDAARVQIALVGNGEAARRRLALLDEAGARHVAVYAEAASPELVEAAGGRLRSRLPIAEEIAGVQLVFLAAVGEPALCRLRQIANRAGVLLNVEDDIAGSDFHSPAVVRRGDLTLAVSTGGKSPALAALIRRRIEASFGPEWRARLERVAALRNRWRAAGLDGAAVARLTTIWLDRQAGSLAGGVANFAFRPALPGGKVGRHKSDPAGGTSWRSTTRSATVSPTSR